MILTKVGLIALVNAAAIHKRAEEISFMPLRSSDGHIPADAQQVFVENQPPQFEPVPTSNAAGGPPPIYQYIVGRDYPASTLRQFPANSREECANLCNAGCDFIVFGNGNCQIKYLNRPSFVGSIFKNQQNANFLFGELHNTPLPQVGVVDGNVQQCIDACNANANCHFASFYYGAVQNSQITGVRNCKMYQFPANADRTIGFRANPNPINVDPQQLGRFDVYGNTGIVALHATLMNNGKILFGARPEYNRGGPNTDNIARQEVPWGEISSLFDIASGTSVPVQIDDNLFCHTMFHLANGDIFTAGGDDYPNVGPATIGLANGLRKQRVYEQGTNRYVNYHDMQIARWYPTALRMPNGDIWVMGGASNGRAGAVAESSIEVFRQGRAPNPVYPLPVMQDNGMALYPIVRMIPGSGNVFVWVGQGWGIHDKNTMQEVQGNHRAVNNIYTNTFPAGSVVLALDPDQGYRADFLIFGGGTGYKNNYAEEVASDQVLRMTISGDGPKNINFDNGRMPYGRVVSDAIIQPSGKVLLFNGASLGRTGGAIGIPDMFAEALDAFLYDPYAADGNRWTMLARTPNRRTYHSTAVLLPDGRTSIQGTDQATYNEGAPSYEHRAEAFTPPWLLDGTPRPVITDAPAVINYNRYFKVTYQGQFTRISLMAPGSGTHGVEFSQRLVFLRVISNVNGVLTLLAPTDPTIALQGYHMLFIVNNDTPSIARWVRLEDGMPVSNENCGQGAGSVCPNDVCCSAQGKCGTTDAFCDAGCQPAFGYCAPPKPPAPPAPVPAPAPPAPAPPAEDPAPAPQEPAPQGTTVTVPTGGSPGIVQTPLPKSESSEIRTLAWSAITSLLALLGFLA